MINTSTEYQQSLAEKKRFIAKATCLLKDGTMLNFDKTSFRAGGIKISDGTSSTSKFDIGSAIINQLTVMIYNESDIFSDYDFSGAVITVWIGMPLADRVEWLKKGVFNASDPTTTPGVITLKALDNMSKFDAVYDGGIGFPASLQSIVQHCCTRCGVLLVNGEFPNFRYQISHNPFDATTNITYRAIIAYCALLAGCYARCNADGRLELKWYDTKAFDGIIDGGVFDETTEASYQTGADLDGGNFTDYSSGDTADGGTFTDVLPYHHIYSFSSLSVSTEDVVITGIRVTAADSEDSAGKKVEGETYLCGAEGYVLDVSGNPLIEAGKAKEVAEYLAGRVVGMRFRPFQASAIGDPSWEAGDAVVVTDRKGNSYYTYLTNITYSTGGYASISCDAEPAARHSADRYAEINKVISDIKKDGQQKLTEYGKMLEQMNGLAINAMGYYETTVKQDDGSDISYMHDKPVLAESKIVYKKSIDGVFWTNDYQGTDAATTAAGKWKSGIDKDGNAVLNVIAAIGISFDWAHGGTLTLGGKDNGNGSLSILDESNKAIGSIDNSGVDLAGNLTLVKKNINNSNCYANFGEVEVLDAVTNQNITMAGFEVSAKGLKGTYSGDIGHVDIIPDVNPFGKSVISSDRVLEITSSFFQASSEERVILLNRTGVDICFRNGNVTTTRLTVGNYGIKVNGTFSASGTKSRVAETKDYGNRLLYCYETPTPYFGDIGTGRTDETGICYVSIDDIFHETVNIGAGYSVFLQKEGLGDVWVEEKSSAFFVVKGTPNLPFSWEIKVIQKDYEYLRLEDCELQDEMDLDNYDKGLQDIFEQELEEYDKEMEELINENFKVVSGD